MQFRIERQHCSRQPAKAQAAPRHLAQSSKGQNQTDITMRTSAAIRGSYIRTKLLTGVLYSMKKASLVHEAIARYVIGTGTNVFATPLLLAKPATNLFRDTLA